MPPAKGMAIRRIIGPMSALESWLQAHNVAVTLVAAVLTAVATSGLAALTWQAVRAASRTITEIRRDRELRQRPHLRWTIGGGAWVEGSNYGVGSAINCIFCTSEPQLWRRTDVADISPNHVINGPTPPGQPDLPLKPQNPAEAPAADVTAAHGMIAFCEDSAGNRYRFRDRFVIPDVWRLASPRPAWVDWYEGQVGYPLPGEGAPAASPSFRFRIAQSFRKLADWFES